MAERTWWMASGRGPASVAVGRRGGCPGADRGTAPLASGAPRPRVLHPGRLPDADPGRAPPVARSPPAGLLRPPVPGGIPVRLGQHPPGAVGLDACRGRDRGPAAHRLGARVAGPLSPGARLVVAAGCVCRSTCSARWRCGPPSGGRWPSSTSRSASSCSSRPGLCCIGCRRTAAGPAPWSCWRPRRGSCSRSARCCTRWCSASWPWRSPRRSACAGSSWPSGAISSCGCPSSR